MVPSTVAMGALLRPRFEVSKVWDAADVGASRMRTGDLRTIFSVGTPLGRLRAYFFELLELYFS